MFEAADRDASEAVHGAELERGTGRRSIATVVFDDGSVCSGDDEILAMLDQRFADSPDAVGQRAKAVEEWPEWLRLSTSSRRV
jgi:hypothetical protein